MTLGILLYRYLLDAHGVSRSVDFPPSFKDYFFITSIMVPIIKDMLDSAVHIGYKRQFWSPRMREYLYGVQNNVYVFDLYKTLACLDEAKKVLQSYTEKGKIVLIVGTKIQASAFVREFAEELGVFYIDSKWVPGFLTNFATLKKRIATYNKLREELANESLGGLTKKERSEQMKELEKLEDAYRGVKDMKRSPDLIFAVDGQYERLALTEAKKLGIPAIAMLGSNGNITEATYIIPCNVNLTRSIMFVLGYLRDAFRRSKSTIPTGDTGGVRKILNKSPRPSTTPAA